jgi:hypothetical protein
MLMVMLMLMLIPQVNNVNSGLRSRGTWTRLVLPESLSVAGSSYMPQSLNVRSITFDIIILLVTVGTCCLLCALWGAWISTRGTTRGRKFGHGSYGDLEDSGHSGTTAGTTAAAGAAAGTADNSHDNSNSDWSDSSSEDGWEYDIDDIDIDGSDSGGEQHGYSCACSRCCRRGSSALLDCGLSGRAKRASDAHQQQQQQQQAAAAGADDVPVATVHPDGTTVVSSGGRSSCSRRQQQQQQQQQQRTVVVETPLPGASKDGIHKRVLSSMRHMWPDRSSSSSAARRSGTSRSAVSSSGISLTTSSGTRIVSDGIGTLKASHSRQALV